MPKNLEALRKRLKCPSCDKVMDAYYGVPFRVGERVRACGAWGRTDSDRHLCVPSMRANIAICKQKNEGEAEASRVAQAVARAGGLAFQRSPTN